MMAIYQGSRCGGFSAVREQAAAESAVGMTTGRAAAAPEI